MFLKKPDVVRGVRTGLALLALFQNAIGSTGGGPVRHRDTNTRTPIKHVIVIIGENRSFDHVFATYKPKEGESRLEPAFGTNRESGRHAWRNFSRAQQLAATNQQPDSFLLSPIKAPFPNDVLPAPLAGGPKDSYVKGD